MSAALLLAAVGESAVITLEFPFGARMSGMGEVGVALADDVSALFWNPAGLGVRNCDWQTGSASASFEFLLPDIIGWKIWHAAVAGIYQLPNSLGGLGIYQNHINMGRSTMYDNMYRPLITVSSFETVTALGWGFSFAEFGDPDRYMGVAFKPFVSGLAPGYGENGEGVAQGFAIDVGYLKLYRNGLRFGMTFTNMGPAVFYIDQGNKDPLPFNVNAALGFKKRFVKDGAEWLKTAMEFRMQKKLVINRHDGDPEPFYVALVVDPFNEPISYELREIEYHIGGELVIMNTVCYRQGIFINHLGNIHELHTGFGLRLFNHLRADFTFINTSLRYLWPASSEYNADEKDRSDPRKFQWQATLTVGALGKWSESDYRWWKIHPERE